MGPNITPTEKMTPAQILVLWRERMGYTRQEAAAEIGCSIRSMVNWETGQLQPPRYIGLAMAALALGMKPYQG